MSNRILFSLVFFLGLVQMGAAQTPSIKTEGKEGGAVYLQKLDVEVSINGLLATTTWTMTFRNSTKRVLEGELNFPLPQGISVSRYALDINGVLREAVPVEKEKATMVFENTERRRIDPGLLEKVEGNTFRTRIYPINPEGVRTVRIGYEQELSGEAAAELRYRLPLAFKNPLESFRIHITVAGSQGKPGFEENTSDALVFDEWKHNWSASKEWTNYQADQPIAIRIPRVGSGSLAGSGTVGGGSMAGGGTVDNGSVVQMQAKGNQYFFMASVFSKAKSIERTAPQKIGLLWDVSLSGLRRDHKKEFELLNAYFEHLGKAGENGKGGTSGKVEVSLVEFSNTVSGTQRFTVDKGDWRELRKTLENAVYDGGTQFGMLNLRDYDVDEFLLCSDGHSSFGSDRVTMGNKPVYAVVSGAEADYPYLQSMTQGSGGELIDLTVMKADKAMDLLSKQPLHFLGVRSAEGVSECYPSMPVPVAGVLTVAGMVDGPKKTIVLQFGYGKTVAMEEKVELDLSRQAATGIDLGRVWAQKKIAELDTRYADNQEEIKHLGRSYGIVTRNTSLVVLESINDYITYNIEPPADLREQYDRMMKGRQDDDRLRRRQVADHAREYFDELLAWWKNETPKAPEKDKNVAEVRAIPDTERYTAVADPVTALEGRVSGMQVQPAPQRGAGSGIYGSRSPNAEAREMIVTGYATTRRKAAMGSVGAGRSGAMEDVAERSGNGGNGGPAVGQGSFTVLKAEENTRYLTALKAAAPGERYGVYLEQRKDYLNTPLFYFHSAEFFIAAGEKTLGLRILSNIAEVDAENYELYKMMGYTLKELGRTAEACITFRRILEWRPFEPQSYRDYGLALEDAGRYQDALDTLYLAMTKNYDATVSGLYPGIEETLLPEINELIALHGGKLDTRRVPKALVAEMPVDMRVVLNWNRASTDIDLWVTDPDNERCYYGHRLTEMGGRISHDFTQGLGPEQFLLKKAVKGRYKVEVNYYGDTQVRLAGETTLLVEVYTHYGTPQQKRSLVTLQMKPGSKGAVYVGDFMF